MGRDVTAENLFFIKFKIKVDLSTIKPLNLGFKIDPRVHDIYNGGERAKQLISVPLDINQTMLALKEALQNTPYTSRVLIHCRRLMSIYLLSKSNQGGMLLRRNVFKLTSKYVFKLKFFLVLNPVALQLPPQNYKSQTFCPKCKIKPKV